MKWKKLLACIIAGIGSALPASAQFGEIVNGLTNVALPIVNQGAGYKGYIEADYTMGVGNFRTNFVSLATSQGYKLNQWFYFGAGVGVDLLWSTVNSGWGNHWALYNPEWLAHQKTSSAWMVPVFTDFRLTLGNITDVSFFVNIRLGAAFLCSDSYVKIRDGYLTDKNYFYMQPAVGMRIPIRKTKPKQAVDIGVHYRLMTSDYWDQWQYTAAINGLGVNISYEW